MLINDCHPVARGSEREARRARAVALEAAAGLQRPFCKK
jgi:hypothetical protein